MPSSGSQRKAVLALVGLALVFDLPAPAFAEEAVGAAAAPATAASQDYYTRRASETLKRDAKLNEITPHPLAAAYPKHSVVVCEAGCARERGAEVVFMEPRQAAAQLSRALSTTAKTAAMIDCVGGCYDTPRRYEAAQTMGPISARPGQPQHTSENRGPFDPRY